MTFSFLICFDNYLYELVMQTSKASEISPDDSMNNYAETIVANLK